ncbi:MAG TPA: M20 family metallopeptidase [Acidimicrobiia bacterium]|nr:M20 family metallopeptidase [Acidimicrobiia bacterium]
MTNLLDAARSVFDDVVALRRQIHSAPELGLELPRTQSAILTSLDGLGLDVTTGTSVSSVVADLRGGAGDGPTILLRADMDALPMPEDTGLEFASTVDGTMHACGHDAHVAMLMGAARVLAAQRDSLRGTIRFAFQPGEEGFAGAKFMIDEGLLDDPNVDGAFALHVAPNLPSGSLWTKGGPLMASADVISITVTGRGGHASTPHLANDPMPVAAEVIMAIQTFVTRRIDAFDPAVITITKVRAGTTNNVIPEAVQMLGTVRTVSRSGRKRALEGLERVVAGIAAAHDMDATVSIDPGYPPTVNDAGFAAFVLEVASELLGADQTGEMPTPVMGAEDFSYVLEERPGALAFLGVCPPGTNPARAASCHSNRMQLDENAMATGVALHCAVATRFLARDR